MSPQGTPLSFKSDAKPVNEPRNEKAVTPISHPNSTSSCSSGADDDSNSISQSGNTATTRRQRSLSAHARTRSHQANELKAAKSSMVARVQLGLIDMVNNSEVTAREKRIHPDESTYTLGDGAQAQEGSIMKPAASEGQFLASPEAQQRRSKQLARGQGADKSKSAIFLQPCRSEEIERQPLLQQQQQQLSIKKTRANQLPQAQSTVFQNLQKPSIGSQDFGNNSIESQREFLAARQLAALQSTNNSVSGYEMPEPDSRRSKAQSRDSSLLQIKKTEEKLSQSAQQQNLTTKASSFLFNNQSEERKNTESQQPKVSLRAVTAPTTVERQIKYLGLVIEKNEEYDIHVDDAWLFSKFRSLRDERIAFESGARNLEENCFIQRQYFPVRERYIRVVKKCRRRVIESFEKRGGRDFRRTRQALNAIYERECRQNQEVQRMTRIQNSFY